MGDRAKDVRRFLLPWIWLVVAGSVVGQDMVECFDEEGRVDVITVKMKQRMGIFPEYPSFVEARLFRKPDSSFVLDVYYRKDTLIWRQSETWSVDDIRNLRQRVSVYRRSLESEVENQEGRVRFIITTTVLATGYYGWAVPEALNIKNEKAALATYMFIGASGFILPYQMTRRHAVTDAHATMFYYGSTRGIIHGLAVNSLIHGNNYDYRRAVGYSVLTSLTEGIAGLRLAGAQHLTGGKSEAIGIGGDLGLWTGYSAMIGLGLEDRNRASAAAILSGSVSGYAAGYWLSGKEEYSRGDAYVMGAVGILGATVPPSIADVGHPGDKASAMLSGFGTMAGVGVGHYLIQGKDFSTGQGVLINLAQLAGAFTGLGLAYLAGAPKGGSAYPVSAAAGAVVGFTATYRTFARDARTVSHSSDGTDFGFFVPGLVQFVIPGKRHHASSMPLLTAYCNF